MEGNLHTVNAMKETVKNMKELNIGVIGYGFRAGTVLTVLFHNQQGVKVNMAAVCDPKEKEILAKQMEQDKIDCTNTRFYTDADQMLEKEQLDGVLIGTRCSLHTFYAEKVLNKKIPLFLEKPVATNQADWEKLKNAYEKAGSEVVVSFPLRITPMVEQVKDLIRRMDIGPIQHVAAFNYPTYGGDYYHNWYRDEQETGGLFLQKATHDLDYLNHILELKPVELCAMTSKQVMKGDKPAGLKCEDCPEKNTCPEGPVHSVQRGDYIHGPWCCYAQDTGNEDSGTVIVRYETGMHVVYTQNFFARNKKMQKRGAIIAGEGGTVEFDWDTNEIIVRKHYQPGEMRCKVETAGNHGGGDAKLVENFIGIMLGTEKSKTPLEQGLLSAHMCLKAKESAQNHCFVKIDYFGGK